MSAADMRAFGDAWGDPITAVMLGDGYDLDRLRSEHVEDGTGHCRACGGPQSGRYIWPCATALAADRAVHVRRERPSGDMPDADERPCLNRPAHGPCTELSSLTVIDLITDETR